MRLFPDALDTLAHFRKQGVPLGLITNGDAGQQRDKIERHGLARFFDTILIEGEFGTGKPEEIVYRHALQALGASATTAWMVGDHLEWDVSAPQRLGVRGVWMDREGHGLPSGNTVRMPFIQSVYPASVFTSSKGSACAETIRLLRPRATSRFRTQQCSGRTARGSTS